MLELERGCSHPTVMNDLCAECGADLRKIELSSSKASVPMVHSVPDLKVSEEVSNIGFTHISSLHLFVLLLSLIDQNY